MNWLALTLLGFVLGLWAQQRARHALVNPTLIATVLVAAALLLSGTPYAVYKAQTQSLSLLLSPAVVALAVPLYRQRRLLARQWPALVIGGVTGTFTAMALDVLLPRWLHLGRDAQRALMSAPATSGVAVVLADYTHAPPALAATLAVLSGLIGAVVLPPFLTLIGVRHPLARGVALGSVAHGIGTARAREEGERQGVASSIGMGLGALAVTLAVAVLSR
ncbi:murein hydrolase transporter LrgB [Deinococcus irradiatisoli]|uniref:Murein hydrolase transporter LrgB n=1 Tax=Deinococcus irradiatisoli TaxID=2202254 RepID=A0A2Z3JG51_9DEIO|nr:LrgB family protein [Deinococcus irradiatisoli]AWN23945.1 murein hydrolase transporter LrgB [Deinococcus irradiatisoli]